MKPREFETLQPHEFYKLFEGYKFRQQQKENILAYFTCWIVNTQGKSMKKDITPKELLKPLRPEKIKQIEINERNEYKKHIKEVFNL